MAIFIPAKNTRHSEKTGQKLCYLASQDKLLHDLKFLMFPFFKPFLCSLKEAVFNILLKCMLWLCDVNVF
jgi:hypothetical protein